MLVGLSPDQVAKLSINVPHHTYILFTDHDETPVETMANEMDSLSSADDPKPPGINHGKGNER